jgi:RimJ/RimL family protein N-acetyltransferase
VISGLTPNLALKFRMSCRRVGEQVSEPMLLLAETLSNSVMISMVSAQVPGLDVMLRDVEETDLTLFFEYESDPAANYMAAFTAKNPADRDAFDAHWKKILGDDTIIKSTVLFEGYVVGSVASFIDQEFGKREVTYWIGREYW